MSDKDAFTFVVVHSDSSSRAFTATLNYDASPVEVYEEFLVFLNAVYGWDTEKYIARLYAKEGI